MAKFDIKTVKPKFVVTTSPENKIDVVVNKPIITSKNTKSFFQLKNTGGPKGEKGDQGEPGVSATITVASTSTGAAGTDASVVNQGTAQDAQLAFTIPRGDKGDTGATGPAGYSPKATVVKTGHNAIITIQDQSGTTAASVSDGQDGQDGQAATIAVDSTTTLPAGSSATVTNVGTSSAASLAFGIPQGVAGQDGADGFSPSASVTQTASGATISITDKDGTTTADVNNGADGADGDAATITVGTVETLQPNQSAYVTNVGSSTAAIFNIGIPQGQKGESGSGSGDMSQVDYDPNSTVKNAGGIPDYVTSQLPGDMTGATSSTAGAHGLVPAPAAGDQGKALMGDGTWKNLPSPELVEMSYGESNAWAKFIAAYTAHCIVYCRASSNSNPATGSQTRKAFMAYVNNETNPTSVEFQYYRSVSSKSDSQQGDQVFVYTLTNSNGGTWSVTTRNTFSKVVAGTNMTSSYSSGTITLNATQPTVPTKTSELTNDGSDGTSTYVEAGDYASASTAGVIKTTNAFGVDMSNSGEIKGTIVSDADYSTMWNDAIVSKGTLENALSTKGYALSTDVPTKTSDLTNDGADGTSTYIEADELATVATSGDYDDLSNKPTIPAAQVNSDWNASSGVSQILNRPGIKNATAATHTDYNNNQDYLPNMRFLSFWNGAYNSSGNSNLSYLANNAVKTANINDSAVTTAKINGSAVTKAKMHGLPCPDYATTITNWGTISSTSTKTTTADGFVVGKAIISGADKQAYIDIGGLQVAGIPYCATSVSNLQVAFCIPVKSGTAVKFTCSSGGSFQGCRLLGWQM